MRPAPERIEVIPSGRALGAEVRGLDIAAGVDDDELSAVIAAWEAHQVIVLRGQHLDDPSLIEFSERLGELDPPGPNPYGEPIYPEYPQLNVISNIVDNGRAIGNLGDGEAVWHADMTYTDNPPKGALLYALELPSEGGNTQFANMRRAFDTLPAALRDSVIGLRAIHDASHNSAGIRRQGYAEVKNVRDTPGARHPIVRTDPRSGSRSLFLGRRPRSYIVGMEVDQSEALLDRLWAHATQESLVFTHRWQMGDLLIWDNLSVLHRRDAFDGGERRRLHRAQLKGEGPIV